MFYYRNSLELLTGWIRKPKPKYPEIRVWKKTFCQDFKNYLFNYKHLHFLSNKYLVNSADGSLINSFLSLSWIVVSIFLKLFLHSLFVLQNALATSQKTSRPVVALSEPFYCPYMSLLYISFNFLVLYSLLGSLSPIVI